MSARRKLVEQIASEAVALCGDHVVFVGVDGVDGAGKTTFAEELAACIRELPVIRASLDGFHNPKAVRYRQGRQSPEGYYEDSYDYAQLKNVLLEPLRPGGSLRYRTAVFDHRFDREVESPWQRAHVPSVLIVDGIFLHRPELVGYWDYSVFLDVSQSEALRRCIEREGVQGVSSDPADPVHHRYVRGQALYLELCDPRSRATRVVNNEDIREPYTARVGTPPRRLRAASKSPVS